MSEGTDKGGLPHSPGGTTTIGAAASIKHVNWTGCSGHRWAIWGFRKQSARRELQKSATLSTQRLGGAPPAVISWLWDVLLAGDSSENGQFLEACVGGNRVPHGCDP
jgi:hypothetical protein